MPDQQIKTKYTAIYLPVSDAIVLLVQFLFTSIIECNGGYCYEIPKFARKGAIILDSWEE
jgi:hypothetical protein